MNNLFNQNDKKMFCFNKTAQKEKIEKTNKTEQGKHDFRKFIILHGFFIPLLADQWQ